MSATLHVQGFGASHGARELFSDLTFTIAPGDVWGLVGANGAGKSTLLRALAGLDPTAHIDGKVTLAPPTASVGYLAQEPERLPGETVIEHLHRRTGVAEAQARMDALADALAHEASGTELDGNSGPGGAVVVGHPAVTLAPGVSIADAYSEALEHWLALGGADLDARAPGIAADIGLGVPLDAHLTTLSGGEAARVGLAALEQ